MTAGGIDIGGTKIEARLFSGDFSTLNVRRIPTPTDSAADLVAALVDQVRWLEGGFAGRQQLPIGVAFPGLVDPRTGLAFTSNLPVGGIDVAAALANVAGRRLPLINDCQAFALSEATGGAGEGYDTVVGVILGTGVGAGKVSCGTLTRRLDGSALEVGHIGVPGRALIPFGLPLWSCGCGKQGCFEQYVSGRGLAALARYRLDRSFTAEEIARSAQAGDPAHKSVFGEWLSIAAELLLCIQLDHDPDCIVIGGGLSRIPDVAASLHGALNDIKLGNMRVPAICVAAHGDSSGARGAAMLAARLSDDEGSEQA